MNFLIKTYGCQMNIYESQKLEEELLRLGLSKVDELLLADLFIINSCSVRQAAEDSVYGLGKQIKALGNKKPIVILTGCVTGAAKTSRRRYDVSYLQNKAPFIDLFLTSEEVLEYVQRFSVETHCNASLQKVTTTSNGLIPISYGCNNFCSYCIVPYARGPERSRPFSEIKQEVEDLIAKGITEIMLLGQNVNSWINNKNNSPSNFAELVELIHDLPGLTKLSFMTSNPWDFGDDLVEVLKLPKIDRYLHLPVQSGDDEVLKRMNRHYTAADYLRLVAKIKTTVPEIEIGTDIIVGFPGETDEEFRHTVELVEKVGFKKIYVSMYSPRKGTVAAEVMKDDVSRKVKRERHSRVLSLCKK